MHHLYSALQIASVRPLIGFTTTKLKVFDNEYKNLSTVEQWTTILKKIKNGKLVLHI